MNQASAANRPAAPDPIGATLLFSLLLHGILLLGITFHFAAAKPALPSLDVTLIDVANQQAPDKADFLAQANNSGGGQSDKAARPARPYAGLLPLPSQGTAPRPLSASAPAPQTATPAQLVTSSGGSSFSVDSDSARKRHSAQPLPQSTRDLPLDQQIAQLTASRDAEKEAYAKRPKKKFISANTQEYVYAAYMRGWVERIERIGNLDYPLQARQQNLHGSLVLTVGLDRNGSVLSIDVIHSSGIPLLDEAAKNIVRLAAPFPPLPASKDAVDQLYITRTWEFGPDNVLRNR